MKVQAKSFAAQAWKFRPLFANVSIFFLSIGFQPLSFAHKFHVFLIFQAAHQLAKMVSREWKALEEDFRAQKALSNLMHLQGKKMNDDLHDLGEGAEDQGDGA